MNKSNHGSELLETALRKAMAEAIAGVEGITDKDQDLDPLKALPAHIEMPKKRLLT